MYYHYNVIQRTEASVHQHELLSKKSSNSSSKDELAVSPLPELPQLTPLFKPLTKIVGTVPVMQVILSTLRRYGSKDRDSNVFFQIL